MFRVTTALRRCALAAVFAALPAAHAAGDDVVDLGSSVPSSKQIEDGLFPDDNCEKLKENGFKCMGFKPPVRFELPSSSFRLGSADLPDGLKAQLDAFASVLAKKSGNDHAVRIEGHADASGNPTANDTLSQRRADAAREYLISKGVAPDLLSAVGVGSKDLADPQRPLAPSNRRVVIGRDHAPTSP